MRAITVEEHFVTPGFLSGPGRALAERTSRPGDPFLGVLEKLREAGPARVAEMDAAGIDVQVLSLASPGAEQSDTAEAAAMARHPGRFSGFATLPIADPPKAAAELERAVHQQNFKGAAINGHHRGRYLDDKFFWPIFECAQSLCVPICLHPTPTAGCGRRRLLLPPIFARTCITRSAPSTSPRRFSICSSNSERTAFFSRPATPTARWRMPAPSSTSSPSAPMTANASPPATPNACSASNVAGFPARTPVRIKP
jgi:hypothetical protein